MCSEKLQREDVVRKTTEKSCDEENYRGIIK